MARFMAALGAAHPLLSDWSKGGRTRKGAPRRLIDQQPDALGALLEAGVIRDDAGQVMENGGFTAWVVNPDGLPISLRVRCGIRSHALGNAVVLNLPALDDSVAGELYRLDVARQVMTAMADCWEPDWATLTSHALRRAQQPDPRTPVVGWITYLSHPRAVDVHALPDGVSAEEIATGTLITFGSEAKDVLGSMVVEVRESLSTALLPTP